MKNKRNVKKTLLIILAVIAALIILVLGGIALYVDYLIGLLVEPSETQPPQSSYSSNGSLLPNPSTTLITGSTGSTSSIPTEPGVSSEPETEPTTVVTEPPIVLNCPVAPIEHGDNIINVMLLGQDDTVAGARSRTDTMILMTINKSTGKIALTSFMRDLLVQIPGYQGYDKMNAAYVYGGYELFKATLLYNFGVQTDFIVHIRYENFAKVVNILGGVDMYLSQAEASYLNAYANEIGAGPWNLTAGVNHLTGTQAFHYSRIRAIDSDYYRVERQKKVLSTIFDTYKSKNIVELLSITTQILPLVDTYDLSKGDVWTYISELLPVVAGSSIQSYRVPFDEAYSTYYYGAYVIVCNMIYSQQKLTQIICG